MKLLDKALDKAVLLSGPVKELTASVKLLTQEMQKLASAVGVLAYNQQVHSYAINQISQTQSIIFKKLTEGAADTSMPEIDVATTSADEAPTKEIVEARKRAQEKPN